MEKTWRSPDEATDRAIQGYLEEFLRIDPHMVIEPKDWFINFANSKKKDLFYITVANPLNFRIKTHADDKEYEFMTIDSPKNRKAILEAIRSVDFESYMNRKGVSARMTVQGRANLLKIFDATGINTYSDKDDTFVGKYNKIDVFEVVDGQQGEEKIQFICLENVFQMESQVRVKHAYIPENYDAIKKALVNTCRFFDNYDRKAVYNDLKKLERFLFVVYGEFTTKNTGVTYGVETSAKGPIFNLALKEGLLKMTLHTVKDFKNIEYTPSNLNKLYRHLDDELVKAGIKVIDVLDEDQILLLNKYIQFVKDYDKDIIIDYGTKEITCKLPYENSPFASIARTQGLNIDIRVNGKSINFNFDKENEIFENTIDYLTTHDARVEKLRKDLEELRGKPIITDEEIIRGNEILDAFEQLPDVFKNRLAEFRIDISSTIAQIENKLEELRLQSTTGGSLSEHIRKLAQMVATLTERVEKLEEEVRILKDK